MKRYRIIFLTGPELRREEVPEHQVTDIVWCGDCWRWVVICPIISQASFTSYAYFPETEHPPLNDILP